MAIAGTIKDIAITPGADKSGDSSEVYVPDQIELRNGVVTPLKNWRRRFGYEQAFAIPENSAVALLIPYGVGFAVMETGSIYRLDNLTKLSTSLRGQFADEVYKPTYVIHKEVVIICDGGRVIKIVDNESSVLEGAPRGKFVARRGSYTVISGYEDDEGEFSEFSWCAADNPLNWTTGDSGFSSIRKDGGTILNMISNGQYLYFFKDNNTEVWSLIGGSTLFARHESASMNVGILGGYSLVRSINSLIWLGHTGDIWELAGGAPQIISVKYKEAISDLFTSDDLIGHDFYEEYKIRWFSNRHAKCFTYDYLNKIWSEENSWANDWVRLPFKSQMYFNGKCYVGSYAPDGKIYEWSKDILDDNGAEIRSFRKFQISPFKELSGSGLISKARLRVKRGVATTSETTPTCTFRFRADRKKWQTRYFDLGANYDKQPFVDTYPNLSGSEFEFELIETDAVEYLVTGLELTLKPYGVR